MYNFVYRLILSQNVSYIAHGFPEIIPFPVQLPLKVLERNLYMLLHFVIPIISRRLNSLLGYSAEKQNENILVNPP